LTGDLVPGGTIVVTATLKDGASWSSQSIEGWTFTTSSATYTIQLAEDTCVDTTPTATLQVSEAACTGGAVTTPVVTLPADTDFISYTKSGAEVPGGTVVVTATLKNGAVWSSDPIDGWVVTTADATYTIHLDDTTCTTANPADPAVTESTCENGTAGLPAITLPADTEAITYTMTGDVVSGGTVTITATLKDGYAWGNTGLAGWSFSEGIATFATSLAAAPDCATPVPTQTQTPGGNTPPPSTPIVSVHTSPPSTPIASVDTPPTTSAAPVTSLPNTGAGDRGSSVWSQAIVIFMILALGLIVLAGWQRSRSQR
jgi:hypothetical protein